MIKGGEGGQVPALAVHRERIDSSCRYRLGTEGMAQVVMASVQGRATISSPIPSVRHAAEAWAGLGWVGERGRCHKKENPRQSTRA